jgi:hypothetical protein
MNFDHIFSAVTGICEIAIWWMIWQDYRIARGKPEFQMPTKKWTLMIALSLIPLGTLIVARETASPVKLNDEHREEIPEYDEPNAGLIIGWGQDSPLSCYMNVNGKPLLVRQSGYKLAIGCFAYDGKEDVLDATYVQVSNLYDIKDGVIGIRGSYQQYFIEYSKQLRSVGIMVALLNVPNGVQPNQFTTLRQARALGVKILQISLAKGAP